MERKPLPDHTILRYEECYAKLALEHCFPSVYVNLKIKDKPDLRDDVHDIGIEVADSMSQKEQEALHCLYMRDYIDDERTKQKCDSILKNYVVDPKCNVFVSSELSRETANKRKEEFLCSVEKKYKTLNKNQCVEKKQGYAEMQHYDLLVLSNWWIEDEHEPVLGEIMNGLCKIGDSIDGQKFEIIFLLGAANICEFDMKKKEYHLVQFSSAEQLKFAEEARELAKNGEKD